MADNEKFAEDMRDAVKALMEADPYYSDIPIVTERLQDLDAKLDETIQLTGGIAIMLLVTTFDEPIQNLPGANFAKVRFAARTIENLNLNATGKTSLQVALHTAALWSQLKPDAFSSPLKLESVDLGNDPRGVNYDTFAFTEGGTKIDIPRLAEVVIELIPFTAGPVETFNDGTRDYTWRPADNLLVLVGAEVSDPDRWTIDPRSSLATESGNEMALIHEHVGDMQVGYWLFERVDGIWSVNFEQLDGSVSAPPALPPDGFTFFTRPTVTMAHPTPGAVIFHTINGTAPAPRNPAASLYLENFNAAPGVTVRARAWLPGYIPSAEARQVL